jgi:hypothetical protein
MTLFDPEPFTKPVPAVVAPPDRHPARYSPEVLVVVAELLAELAPAHVHDPFAGTGVRLATLCDELGIAYTGTDIEEWPGRDRRVQLGDSLDPATYPVEDFTVVTSPVYVNKRLADYPNGPTPTTKVKGRRDYGIALGRALHPRNLARLTGRPNLAAQARHEDAAIVKLWGAVAVVNVDGPIGDRWAGLLAEAGYRITATREVKTQRYGGLDNAEVRADHEVVLVATRHHNPEPEP